MIHAKMNAKKGKRIEYGYHHAIQQLLSISSGLVGLFQTELPSEI